MSSPHHHHHYHHHASNLDSLVPLLDSDFPEFLQELNFDGIFDLPAETLCNAAGESNDDFGFDVLNSYSLDDLYQLLDEESPDQNSISSSTALNIHKSLENCSDYDNERSVVIQTKHENDLYNILGVNTPQDSSWSNRSEFHRKGVFSELGISQFISSSSNSNCNNNTSCTNQIPCTLSPTKRRKFEGSSVQSLMSQEMKTSQTGLWIDERSSSSCAGPHQEDVRKKRVKRGESRKQRPKDRQMIQDRIKELREMVPNGSKCSIDALLHLTIKHMLFMQSISEYSDTLKQSYEPKLIKQQWDSRERSSTTWGLEVGDESSVLCPVIVGDLNPSGQMQIEMLCEEHEQFLEITDVMRGLGLNVLKGVMERRDDNKIWAHYIVEAKKKQVTRLHVLCSLLHHFYLTTHNSS